MLRLVIVFWYTGVNVRDETAASVFREEEEFYSEDGGCRFLCHTGAYLPNYTVSHSL